VHLQTKPEALTSVIQLFAHITAWNFLLQYSATGASLWRTTSSC